MAHLSLIKVNRGWVKNWEVILMTDCQVEKSAIMSGLEKRNGADQGQMSDCQGRILSLSSKIWGVESTFALSEK